MAPITVSYRDLGFDVDAPEIEIESGESWFNAQDETTQRTMMGPAKYDAWQAGEIELADLVSVHNDPIYGDMRGEASLVSILGGTP